MEQFAVEMMKKQILFEQDEPIAEVVGEPFIDYMPPEWDVYFMRLSYEVATKSKDPSSKFGAVIVRDKRPILFGYNGLPPKVEDLPERLISPVKYKWTLHAEANAIACAAKFGISTDGADLYIAGMPCAGCAALITAAGIRKVFVHSYAKNIFSQVSHYGEDDEITSQMFKEAGIPCYALMKKTNKMAYLGGKIYHV